jgi:hypothetical protein
VRQHPSYFENPFVLPSRSAYWKGHSRKEDNKLARELFFGRRVRDETGRARKKYLAKDSAGERSAREALVRLLSHDDVRIKALLCDALSSDGIGERRLVFQPRKKGKRSDVGADYAVAFRVLIEKHDTPVESAVHDAMAKFGLSRKSVFACMKRVKEFLRSGRVNVVS